MWTLLRNHVIVQEPRVPFALAPLVSCWFWGSSFQISTPSHMFAFWGFHPLIFLGVARNTPHTDPRMQLFMPLGLLLPTALPSHAFVQSSPHSGDHVARSDASRWLFVGPLWKQMEPRWARVTAWIVWNGLVVGACLVAICTRYHYISSWHVAIGFPARQQRFWSSRACAVAVLPAAIWLVCFLLREILRHFGTSIMQNQTPKRFLQIYAGSIPSKVGCGPTSLQSLAPVRLLKNCFGAMFCRTFTFKVFFLFFS